MGTWAILKLEICGKVFQRNCPFGRRKWRKCQEQLSCHLLVLALPLGQLDGVSQARLFYPIPDDHDRLWFMKLDVPKGQLLS